MKPLKKFMRLAILEAKQAKQHGDYPIGAVIVKDNQVVMQVGNKSKLYEDPTLHAEIVAIQSAARIIGRKALSACIIYCTHEPCPMCMGAIIYARLSGAVFGARIEDMKSHKLISNSSHSWRTIEIPAREILQKSKHEMELLEDFMRNECKKLFETFE